MISVFLSFIFGVLVGLGARSVYYALTGKDIPLLKIKYNCKHEQKEPAD